MFNKKLRNKVKLQRNNLTKKNNTKEGCYDSI